MTFCSLKTHPCLWSRQESEVLSCQCGVMVQAEQTISATGQEPQKRALFCRVVLGPGLTSILSGEKNAQNMWANFMTANHYIKRTMCRTRVSTQQSPKLPRVDNVIIPTSHMRNRGKQTTCLRSHSKQVAQTGFESTLHIWLQTPSPEPLFCKRKITKD